ncbi:MAG: hypothetical protein QMD65_02105 [Patescibacteria group bacterium]|nr:hypothetical protein [Patescibacteria group bacterium]
MKKSLKRTKLRKESKEEIPKLKKELKRLSHEFVRKRDKRCQAKGIDGRKCWGYLSASHIYPEGTYKNIQFELLNMIGLCHWHHIYFWHKNPIEAGEWVKKYLGDEKYEALKQMSKNYFQWDKESLMEEIKKYG